MLDFILNLDSLELTAKQLDEFLENQPSEDPGVLVEHGNELIVWLSRSGKLLADAGYWRDAAIVRATEDVGLSLPPSIMAKYINAKCQRENYIYTLIERHNRACVHRLDFIRTLISKAKAELQYQNMQP